MNIDDRTKQLEAMDDEPNDEAGGDEPELLPEQAGEFEVLEDEFKNWPDFWSQVEVLPPLTVQAAASFVPVRTVDVHADGFFVQHSVRKQTRRLRRVQLTRLRTRTRWLNRLTWVLRAVVLLFSLVSSVYLFAPLVLPPLISYLLRSNVDSLQTLEMSKVDWSLLDSKLSIGEIKGQAGSVEFLGQVNLDYRWGSLWRLQIPRASFFARVDLPKGTQFFLHNARVHKFRLSPLDGRLTASRVFASLAILGREKMGAPARDRVTGRIDSLRVEDFEFDWRRHLLKARRIKTGRSDLSAHRDLIGRVWVAGVEVVENQEKTESESKSPINVEIGEIEMEDWHGRWQDEVLSPGEAPVQVYGKLVFPEGLNIVGENAAIAPKKNQFEVQMGFVKESQPFRMKARCLIDPPRLAFDIEKADFDNLPLEALGFFVRRMPERFGVVAHTEHPILKGVLTGRLLVNPQGVSMDAKIAEPMTVHVADEEVAIISSLSITGLNFHGEDLDFESALGAFSVIVEAEEKQTSIAGLKINRTVTGDLDRSHLAAQFQFPKGAKVVRQSLHETPFAFRWALTPLEDSRSGADRLQELLEGAIDDPQLDSPRTRLTGWIHNGQLALPKDGPIGLSGDVQVSAKVLSLELLSEYLEVPKGEEWPRLSVDAWCGIAIVDSNVSVHDIVLQNLTVDGPNSRDAQLNVLEIKHVHISKEQEFWEFGAIDIRGLSLTGERSPQWLSLAGLHWREQDLFSEELGGHFEFDDWSAVGDYASGPQEQTLIPRDLPFRLGPTRIDKAQINLVDRVENIHVKDLRFDFELPQGLRADKDFELLFYSQFERCDISFEGIADIHSGTFVGDFHANRVPHTLMSQLKRLPPLDAADDLSLGEVTLAFEFERAGLSFQGDLLVRDMAARIRGRQTVFIRSLEMSNFFLDAEDRLFETGLDVQGLDMVACFRPFGQSLMGLHRRARLRADILHVFLPHESQLEEYRLNDFRLDDDKGRALLSGSRLDWSFESPAAHESFARKPLIQIDDAFVDLLVNKKHTEIAGMRISHKSKAKGKGKKTDEQAQTTEAGWAWHWQFSSGRLRFREQPQDIAAILQVKQLSLEHSRERVGFSGLLEGLDGHPFKSLYIESERTDKGLDVREISLSRLNLQDLSLYIERHSEYRGLSGTLDLENSLENADELHLRLDDLHVEFPTKSLSGKQLAASAAAFLLTNGDFFMLEPETIEIDVPKSALGWGLEQGEDGLSAMTGEIVKLGVKAAMKPLLSPATFFGRVASEGFGALFDDIEDDAEGAARWLKESEGRRFVGFLPGSAMLVESEREHLREVAAAFLRAQTVEPRLRLNLSVSFSRADAQRLEASQKLGRRSLTDLASHWMGRLQRLEWQRTRLKAKWRDQPASARSELRQQLRATDERIGVMRRQLRTLLNRAQESRLRRQKVLRELRKELVAKRLKVVRQALLDAKVPAKRIRRYSNAQSVGKAGVILEFRGLKDGA